METFKKYPDTVTFSKKYLDTDTSRKKYLDTVSRFRYLNRSEILERKQRKKDFCAIMNKGLMYLKFEKY